MTRAWEGWVALVGDEERARHIAQVHGGRMLSIPAAWKPSLRLADDLAPPLLRRIIALRGGSRVYVPVIPKGSEMQAEILHLAREGLGAAAISRRLGCTDRWVRRVLAR